MGRINLFTLLTMVFVQIVVGYVWFGPYLFGAVVTAGGGHGIDFLKLDIVSLLLVVLSSYGLTGIMGLVTSRTGKAIGGTVKTGLLVGSFGIGFPLVMLLNLMGADKALLLVVFAYVVLITILGGVVTTRFNKA